MRTETLFNQLRPLTWWEVVDQNVAVISLKNILVKNKLPNGLILSGTRGVGKTTIARIFARALNCKNPQDGNPCNQCPSCLMSLADNHPDILEIDGASNNKVDDVRLLLEKSTHYPISGSKFKIYIIDEAHNLSTSVNAWDTLLKELEEPKEYLFWIFCTTQKKRIPLAIRSRLLSFDLRHIPSEKIYDYIKKIEFSTERDIPQNVLRLVSLKANNSLRDALSLLEKLAPFMDDVGWTEANLYEALGSVEIEFRVNILHAILDNNLSVLWDLMDKAINSGVELNELFNSILNCINFVLSAFTNHTESFVEYENEYGFSLLERLDREGIKKFINIGDILLKRKSQLEAADNKKFVLQLTCAELCS